MTTFWHLDDEAFLRAMDEASTPLPAPVRVHDPEAEAATAALVAELNAFLAASEAARAADKVATTPTPPKRRKSPAPVGSGATRTGPRLVSLPSTSPDTPSTTSTATTAPSTVTDGASEASGIHPLASTAPRGVPDYMRRLIARGLVRLHPFMSSRHRRPVLPTRWRDHDPLQKAHRAAEAFTLTGTGLAFSLNLSDDRAETLRQHADPVRHMSHRINSELKAAGLELAFGFSFDLTPSAPLHVHGMVERPADPADLERLKDALRRAGGKFAAAARQLTLRTITTGWGWVHYSVKAARAVATYLGQPVAPFLSRRLTQLAEAHTARVQALAKARLAAPAPTTTPAEVAAPAPAHESAAAVPVPARPSPLAGFIDVVLYRGRLALSRARQFRDRLLIRLPRMQGFIPLGQPP